MANNAIVSVTTPSGPLVDTKTGQATFAFTKWLQNIGQVINKAFDSESTLSGSSLPYPSTSSLGGVLAFADMTHEWINSIDNTGAPHSSQPSFTDISGVASPSQVPALSGLTGTVSASQVPNLSSLSGSVTPAQVPPLSQLQGQVTNAQLPFALGMSVTITTAKLTVTGANGSMTFTSGILTSQVAAT